MLYEKCTFTHSRPVLSKFKSYPPMIDWVAETPGEPSMVSELEQAPQE